MADDFYSVTGTTVVPKSTTTTDNVVIGAGEKTGTTTKGTLRVGDWIVDNVEARRVVSVTPFESGGIESITFTLARAFTSAISGVVEVVSSKSASVVYMEIDGATSIDGVAVSGIKTFGNQNDAGDVTKFVRPRTVVGDAVISLEYINNQLVD